METKKTTQITLIGVGSSAGGMEALQELLENLPDKLQNVAIIVAQHLSNTHKSRLVELLSKHTSWTVTLAEQGQVIVPQTVYITPTNVDIQIFNHKIKLSKPSNSLRPKPSNSLRPKPSVDMLFESLALQYQDRAIGVILSGMGFDGTIGAKAIKDIGGYIIAQEPTTAKYDAMPLAAIESGNIDWVLPPGQIGEEIYHLLKDSDYLTLRYRQEALATTSLQQVFKILSAHTGTDFTNYKPSTIFRRLEKCIADLKLKNVDEYLIFLEDKPHEVEVLVDTILIGVTSFFRDKEAFAKLETYMTRVIQSKRKNDNIRVWVAGCATGEEAYSIGILIHKLLKSLEKNYQVQIFATDIDKKAINKARKGVYPASSLMELPNDIIENYFIKKGNDYEVVKAIKSMILFSKHDVTTNPPFLKLDLITCRNLLIYFDRELQKKVIPIFHYALNTNGYLFLGKSETVGHFINLFSTIEVKAKIFQQKRTQKTLGVIKHFKPMDYNFTMLNTNLTKKNSENTLETFVKETIYHHFEHPYVIVNDIGDIQEIRGNMNSFLTLPEGSINTNIIKLVLPDLQMELRSIFAKAIKEKKIYKSRIKKVNDNNDLRYIRMSVCPLLFTDKENESFMITFEVISLEGFEELLPQLLVNNDNLVTESDKSQDQQRLLELEHELAVTEEHLQSFIEQLENNNEELQFLNEELQSTNEELQASNEELETSNEELQAATEEVQTAYDELRVANEELQSSDKLLKASETNLASLLNNSMKGYCLIDKNYKIILHNIRFMELCNNISQKKLLVGENITEYIQLKKLKNFDKKIKEF